MTAAASLGLALTSSAQSSVDTAPESPSAAGWGLLGTNYANVLFRYTDLDGGPPSAQRGVGLQFNQVWRDGIDAQLNYDWGRASADAVRLTAQNLNVGATVYSKLDWGRPYVQALAGWEWRRGAGSSDNSFAYTLGTGVEFPLTRAFTLTPYINFVRATGFNSSEFDYGTKATYRVNHNWGVTAGFQYDSVNHRKDAKEYTLGVNYRY